MSRWNGPAHKGAMREVRTVKRSEAEERNDGTAPQNRRQYRLNPANRLLVDVFTAEDCDCDSDAGICCHDSDHCYCVEEGHLA